MIKICNRQRDNWRHVGRGRESKQLEVNETNGYMERYKD